MSPQEYKQLSNKVVPALQERLPENDIKVLQQESPFGGMLIGISLFKGSTSYETYELNNNGEEASYQFKGIVQTR
tara:strand:- start:15 stop:239 length:225 start_codon:yes stop_codon:yes gene_type:complete